MADLFSGIVTFFYTFVCFGCLALLIPHNQESCSQLHTTFHCSVNFSQPSVCFKMAISTTEIVFLLKHKHLFSSVSMRAI